MIDRLTIALTYYNAPLMLAEQVKYWSWYPEKLIPHVKIILIDDCSQIHPAEHEIRYANLKMPVEVYRIKKDIPQNLFGARNLAFHIASTERLKWVLSLDIDHILPSRALDGFVEVAPTLKSDVVYYPSRYTKYSSNIVITHRHLDSYLISPELFWKTGGYDEDLTGFYYNGASLRFRKSLRWVAQGEELLTKIYTFFYPSSLIADASPLSGQEKKTYDGAHREDKKPSVLNFEWERVL